MPKVQFINVGRDKKSWTTEINSVSESSLVASIEKQRALMSRDIECDMETGTIIVGGFRPVGAFIIHENA